MGPPVYPIPAELAGDFYIMPGPSGDRLEDDLRAVHSLGITKIVSLLEEDEAQTLGLAGEGNLCGELGMSFVRFPIPDRGLPEAQDFRKLIVDIRWSLQSGVNTSVHCRAGIGRSGMLACCVLIDAGIAPEQALDMVSRARRVQVPDTIEQKQFVLRYGLHSL